MSLRRITTLAAFIALGLPQQAVAGDLTGRVTDNAGTPLPGANIVVRGSSLSGPKGTVSDASGSYSVRGIAAGTYEIHVTHIGYRVIIRDNVQVAASAGTTTLDFSLQPAVIYLEQSVVTASRTQEKALDSPASIAVVDAAEIRDNPVLTVTEHIKDLPGVDFAQTGLVQSNVVARGFNNIFSGALLTLTDNRIARVPSLRLNANNFIPVTNEDIERIELVLGPGSALYGPNSANGVMHVITRSPFTSGGTDVSIGFGERSLRKGSVRHAGMVNANLAYKISAQYYTGTDWKYNDPVEDAARKQEVGDVADAADRTLKARDFDIQRQSVEARLDYRPTEEMTAILSYGYNQGDHIELTGLGAGQALDWSYNYVQTRFIYKDLFAQYFHNWSDAGDTFLLRTGTPVVDKSTLDVFQLQHATELSDKQQFTYGLDALLTRPDTDGTITGNNENDDDVNEVGVYLQSETDLTKQLDLVLALRYDKHNRVDDSVLSPRAALLFKPSSNQTMRLTYNRAFSTPTTNNLYLDLVAQSDPYDIVGNFGHLGVGPIDVRTQGTFQEDNEGLTFVRNEETGLPKFRSPFGALAGLPAATYIDMNDPIFTNVMWNIGRGAVFASADQFALVLQDRGMDEATAQGTVDALVGALPAVIPEQLIGLRNMTMKLNLAKAAADDPNPFDLVPLTDVTDVRLTEPTITQTLEIGYKGIVNRTFVVAVDAYRTETEDFVGPLAIETPNVFLDPNSISESLGPIIEAAASANAVLAGGLQALDGANAPGLISGEANGSGVDELTSAFALGAARIPFGTISPEQAYDPHAVILTYRNFGDVTLYGLDLSVGFYPNDIWSVTGSYSFVDDNFFSNLGGIDDVALNAPQHKFRVGGSYTLPQHNLRLSSRVRYNGSYPMKSGVYEGDVDSHTVVDLKAAYDLPFGENLSLITNIDNVLDNTFRAFIGAPEVGRLAYVQLGVSF